MIYMYNIAFIINPKKQRSNFAIYKYGNMRFVVHSIVRNLSSF